MSLQLDLPLFQLGDPTVSRALVEVVYDPKKGRCRVRPIGLDGWVRFPKRRRILGAVYRVECLKPRPGGAWTAIGRIRRLRLAFP